MLGLKLGGEDALLLSSTVTGSLIGAPAVKQWTLCVQLYWIGAFGISSILLLQVHVESACLPVHNGTFPFK